MENRKKVDVFSRKLRVLEEENHATDSLYGYDVGQRGLVERLKRLDFFFWSIAFFGLALRPSQALHKGKAPLSFVIYCWILNCLAIASAAHNVYVSITGIYHKFFSSPLVGSFVKYAYTVFTLNCTLLRVACSSTTSKSSFLQDIRTALLQVTQVAPEISTRSNAYHSYCTVIQVTGGVVMVSYICLFSAYILVVLDDTAYQHLWFHVILLESYLHITALIGSLSLLGILTFGPVIQGFSATTRQFKDAIEDGVNLKKLVLAVNNHGICCSLTAVVDRLASQFIGISLCTVIPLFSTVATILVQHEIFHLTVMHIINMLVWLIGSTLITLFIIACAHYVTEAAHQPMTLVSKHMFRSSSSNCLIETFLRRFQSSTIGYSFFKIAPVRKATFLVVLNLMTTYILVGIQLTNQPFTCGNSTTSSSLGIQRIVDDMS